MSLWNHTFKHIRYVTIIGSQMVPSLVSGNFLSLASWAPKSSWHVTESSIASLLSVWPDTPGSRNLPAPDLDSAASHGLWFVSLVSGAQTPHTEPREFCSSPTATDCVWALPLRPGLCSQIRPELENNLLDKHIYRDSILMLLIQICS